MIALLQWLVTNWQLIATIFSSVSSLALFFLHGNAAAELKLIKAFIDSLQISQPGGPIDPGSAQAQARQSNPAK